METIGQRIAEKRKEAGLTQQQIALKIGNVSRSLVGQIEKDLSKPSLDFLVSFVSITNTSLDYIITGLDSPSSKASRDTDHHHHSAPTSVYVRLTTQIAPLVDMVVKMSVVVKTIREGKVSSPAVTDQQLLEVLGPFFELRLKLMSAKNSTPEQVADLENESLFVLYHYQSELRSLIDITEKSVLMGVEKGWIKILQNTTDLQQAFSHSHARLFSKWFEESKTK